MSGMTTKLIISIDSVTHCFRLLPPRNPSQKQLCWLKYLGKTLYLKMQPLTIRIKDGNGEETQFRVNPTVYMAQVFIAYSHRRGVSRATLRFLLDGERVGDFDTPYLLALEDGDQIDAILEQVGD